MAFLKPSQNQIGEMLFKSVALQRTDTGTARVARRRDPPRHARGGPGRPNSSARPERQTPQPSLTVAQQHILDGILRDDLERYGYDATDRAEQLRGTVAR